MIAFWIIAALMLSGALLFVLPPLLTHKRQRSLEAEHNEANLSIYRDQLAELDVDLAAGTLSAEAHQRSRNEIEKRLLQEIRELPRESKKKPKRIRGGRRTAVIVGVALPALALSLYLILGNPAAMDPKGSSMHGREQVAELTSEQVIGMVESLAERLAQEPDDAEGWAMLGRSYQALQRFPEAAKAYANAVERMPKDAQLLADYADVLAATQNRSLQGEPEDLALKALNIDPLNVKALSLAGAAAYQRKDFSAATSHWRKILALLPDDSELAQAVRNSIVEAQRLGGMASAAAQDGSTAAAAPATAGDKGSERQAGQPAAAAPVAAAAKIEGVVSLDPRLATLAAPTDTLFIFARAAQGPRVPLAIRRAQVKDLPLAFSLDDSMAMAPEMKLSRFRQVIVGARISKSGNAMPATGDLEGLSPVVDVGAVGLAITINNEIK